MNQNLSRHIAFDFVGNLRDLGGYNTKHGKKVAWRKLFRSGEVKPENAEHVAELREKAGIASILDLRGSGECTQERIDLLTQNGIQYRSIPLLVDAVGPGYEEDLAMFERITRLDEFYMLTMLNRQGFPERLAEALAFIADPANQPVLFHCALGKDRTGILSAAILDILGVPHEEIIKDYHLTDAYMPAFIEDLTQTDDGKKFYESLPAYMWRAEKETMESVLSDILANHGSFSHYLANNQCDPSLAARLADTLLDGE